MQRTRAERRSLKNIHTHINFVFAVLFCSFNCLHIYRSGAALASAGATIQPNTSQLDKYYTCEILENSISRIFRGGEVAAKTMRVGCFLR